jgi:hypothetical protein
MIIPSITPENLQKLNHTVPKHNTIHEGLSIFPVNIPLLFVY